MPPISAPASMSSAFELDQPWALSPRVSIRPEPFGALLYNFGTRQLSFLKDRRLVAIVASLAEHIDVRHACLAHGVAESELAQFATALARLAATHMIVPRTAGEPKP
jgi:putative mycofactocin binding protein MftB